MPFLVRGQISTMWTWQLAIIAGFCFFHGCASGVKTNNDAGRDHSLCDSLEIHLKSHAIRHDTRISDVFADHDEYLGEIHPLDTILLSCNLTLLTYDLSGFSFSVLQLGDNNSCEILDTDDLYDTQGEWGDVNDIQLLNSSIKDCKEISGEDIRLVVESMYDLSYAKLEDGGYSNTLEHLSASIANLLPSPNSLDSLDILLTLDSIAVAQALLPVQDHEEYYYFPDYTIFVCLRIPHANPIEFSLHTIDLAKLFIL